MFNAEHSILDFWLTYIYSYISFYLFLPFCFLFTNKVTLILKMLKEINESSGNVANQFCKFHIPDEFILSQRKQKLMHIHIQE